MFKDIESDDRKRAFYLEMPYEDFIKRRALLRRQVDVLKFLDISGLLRGRRRGVYA